MSMTPENVQSPWTAQIGKIRADLEVTGESILTVAELRNLCPGLITSVQWQEIAKGALTQRWAFTFFPNGGVRFEKLKTGISRGLLAVASGSAQRVEC